MAVLTWTVGLAVLTAVITRVDTALSPGDVAAQQIFDRYFDWRQEDNPEFATIIGNHSYDDRLTSSSMGARQKRMETMKLYLSELENIPKSDLSFSTQISINILKENIRTYVDGQRYKGYLFPSVFLYTVAESLRRVVQAMKFRTENDYRNLVKRYGEFPRKVDEVLMHLKLGMEEGMVLHIRSMETVPAQLRAHNVSVEESVFYEPFLKMPEEIGEPIRSELEMKGRRAVQIEVIGELLKLADFIETEYLPNSRPALAVSSLPNGEEFYAACLRFYTSTELTAEQIHQRGLKEVERIEKEMMKIARGQGFRGDTISAFSEKLRNDPNNYYSDPDGLIEGFADIIYSRINPLLPSVVCSSPKDPVIVERRPANQRNAVSASYQTAPFDGSGPGKFLVNVFIDIPKYIMTTVSLHEANPGHHLYYSALKNNPGLPKFRRTIDDKTENSIAPSGFPRNTVIWEGWALYAEFLGEEMGVYEDRPIERYGAYNGEIFRACRLVVDTGLHAFNWTEQEAIDYILKHTATSRSDIENEVRRYITWPGQATSYKMGELRIKDLRSRAIKQLGDKFDLRVFHQVLLDCAGPLSVVEQCVNKYIQDHGVWESATCGVWSYAGGADKIIILFSCILVAAIQNL